jgi:hypothetical protein
MTIAEPYPFKSSDGSFYFTVRGNKGNGFATMENQFEKYKEKNALDTDVYLCRTFKIEILHFWKWIDYVVCDEYDYPYCKN